MYSVDRRRFETEVGEIRSLQLVCAAAVGLGWRAAVKTADRVTRVAARLDQGLSEADEQADAAVAAADRLPV